MAQGHISLSPATPRVRPHLLSARWVPPIGAEPPRLRTLARSLSLCPVGPLCQCRPVRSLTKSSLVGFGV
jgi:hypothetical protein